MNTISRGNPAEAQVIAELEKLGVTTLLPFGGGCPFDIAALLPDDRIIRVQVKCGRVRRGVIMFNAHSTDHGRGPLHYRDRADVFAVYAAEIGRAFMIPVDECPVSDATLRLDAPRNNQRLGVRFAGNYSIERWASALGVAAA